MDIQLALLTGVLYSIAIFLMLRRSIVKLVFGLALLGHASNLLIFSIGRVTHGAPPIIDPGATALLEPYADPLPQALILTAIVIGFGVQAFAIILVRRLYLAFDTDDLDRIS